MNSYRKPSRTRGFVLIEAMIALVVLSFGIVSIAKLQSELLASSGYTKARAEAVQIAEREMERLRNMIIEDDFTVLTTGTDTVSGTNAAFTRTTTVGPIVSGRRSIQVTLSWVDPKEGLQEIRLDSTIAWDDPATGVAITAEPAVPEGGRVSLGLNPPPITQFDGVPEDAVDVGDGWYEYVDDQGGRYLLDETGKALEYIPDGSAFSYINGKIYIDVQSFNQQPDVNTISITRFGSDRDCKIMSEPLEQLPEGATGNAIMYRYIRYRCNVPPGWSGRVGIYRSTGAQAGDRFCVGDPTVAPSALAASRHPALDSNRLYRGFEVIALGHTITGIAPGITLTEHNFLMARITGNPTDTSCTPRMSLTTPSPFAAPDGSDPLGGVGYSQTHPGRFFCLTATCPDAMPVGVVPTTVISVTIDRRRNPPVSGGVVTALSITGGECEVTSTSATAYGYDCTIDWRGWEGVTWSGAITVQTDHVLCESGATAEAMDADGNPIAVDFDIDPIAKTISFTDIAPSLTQMDLDFAVRHPDGTCP